MLLTSRLRIADTFPQISDYVCRLELKFGRGRTPSWQKEFPENHVLVVQDRSEDLTIFKHMMVSPTRYFLKWLQRRLEAKLKASLKYHVIFHISRDLRNHQPRTRTRIVKDKDLKIKDMN